MMSNGVKVTGSTLKQVAKEGTAGYLASWKQDLPPAEAKKEEEVTILDELGM